jgi:alpha-methylacyl-CoA racemase
MGPLVGMTVVEIAGLGPAPHVGMMLADMGADVILVERKLANKNAISIDSSSLGKYNLSRRGKRSIEMDLKQPKAIDAVLALIENADVLLEGFRPGVMERLGLGPDICFQQNEKLVYARLTGWGQTGPLAKTSGHGINYIAPSGALHYSGHEGEAPFPPATILSDVAAGSMHMVFGVLCAYIHAKENGEGQIVDAAMLDGGAYMATLLYGLSQHEKWTGTRSESFLHGAAHWFDTYECADGKYIAIAPVEPAFYRELLLRLDLAEDEEFVHGQYDMLKWPLLKTRTKELFRMRRRDEWCGVLEGTDACFAPVLDLSEAPLHAQNQARENFLEIDGVVQPAPAPKFGRTIPEVGKTPIAGMHTAELLGEIGFDQRAIEAFIEPS